MHIKCWPRARVRKILYLLGMDFKKTYQNEQRFSTITSIYPEEFDVLFRAFEPRWLQAHKHYNFRGKRRSKPLTSKQLLAPTKTLPTNREKLFFILYLYKINPLQDVAGATFDMDQGQVSRWKKVLTPILLQALKDLDLHAARNTEELIRLFRTRQRKKDKDENIDSMHIDVTERPIQRNKDKGAQRNDYSRKQAGHTIKNTIICDEYQFIHFAGFTWRGAIHDKAMVDEEVTSFGHPVFADLWLSKDAGYQGYLPSGINILEPFKPFRDNPITEFQKEFNRWVSSIRTVVEDAIGGVKRLRSAFERVRKFLTYRADQTLQVAVGLHNLRVSLRDSYSTKSSCVRANLVILDT